MTTCVNGWDGIPNGNDSRLTSILVPGTKKRVTVRREAAPVFAAILSEINKKLIPLDGGPLDGWEYRETRTGQGLSAHAGGVAVDFRYDVLLADNELHWPASKHDTMHKLMDKYVTSSGKRVFGWGGDWTPGKYCDEMHLELIQSWSPGSQGENCTLVDVANVIKRLGIKPDGTTSIIAKIIAPITPKPKPPVTKGAAWCSAFLTAQGLTGATHKIVWTLAGRESGWDASMVYPAGNHDWASEQPPFDVGFLQCNSTHLPEIRTMFGPSANMKAMLDAGNCFRYSAKLSNNWTDFTAWGIGGVNADGTVRFDWSQYPQTWLNKQVSPGVTQQQESEQAFLAIWKQYVAPNAKPTPAPKPVPAPKPTSTVSLAALLKHDVSAVKSVQAALNKVVGTTLTVDGLWGPKTQAAYDKFRSSSMGLSGNAATGTPGVQSLTALGKAGGFTVVK